jgi:hypothetical protein
MVRGSRDDSFDKPERRRRLENTRSVAKALLSAGHRLMIVFQNRLAHPWLLTLMRSRLKVEVTSHMKLS